MMDKNEIRKITPTKLAKTDERYLRMAGLRLVVESDLTYRKMAEIAGVTEYEVRRFLGLIQ